MFTEIFVLQVAEQEEPTEPRTHFFSLPDLHNETESDLRNVMTTDGAGRPLVFVAISYPVLMGLLHKNMMSHWMGTVSNQFLHPWTSNCTMFRLRKAR